MTARTLKTITREADAMHMRTTVGRFGPPRSRGDGGFTLIELMVTMVIAGLLFALAVGGYRAYAASQAQRGTAEGIVVLMREAQQRAVTEGVAYGIDLIVFRAMGALEEPKPRLLQQARQRDDSIEQRGPQPRWCLDHEDADFPSFCVYFRRDARREPRRRTEHTRRKWCFQFAGADPRRSTRSMLRG